MTSEALALIAALNAALTTWIQQAIHWLRVPVTPTAIRWEVLSLAGMLLAGAVAIFQLWRAGTNYQRVLHEGVNGGLRRTAYREVRSALNRVARLTLWVWLFAAFTTNATVVVALVAFVPLLYALSELLDGALDERVRAQNQAYFEDMDERARQDRAILALRRRLLALEEEEQQQAPQASPGAEGGAA